MTYFDNLYNAQANVASVLIAKGINADHVSFGGSGKAPERSPRVPTDARSEFLANRAMGDWAENLLASALRTTCPDWQVSHFGETNSIAAGHQDFKTHYLNGLEEVRVHGKRPDLLLFDKLITPGIPDNLSILEFNKINQLASQAIGSIEVRSSKFDALTYMDVRARQRESGKKASRDAPSFTVKVEDLIIVYRWLEQKKIPQAYFQVFFDSVFAINVLDIFTLIGNGLNLKNGIVIETPANSQEKATIMIPITFGIQVGTVETAPEFLAEHKITELGRHDAYVKPVGGSLVLDAAAVRRVMLL